VNFVPNSGNLSIDPQKLTYLLQTDQGKAKFFVAICGFDPSPAARTNSTRHSASILFEIPTTT
jgi:hypothetical protein